MKKKGDAFKCVLFFAWTVRAAMGANCKDSASVTGGELPFARTVCGMRWGAFVWANGNSPLVP